MEDKKLLDEYKMKISKILGCSLNDILFYKDCYTGKPTIVEDFTYYKPIVGSNYAIFSVRLKNEDKEEKISTFSLYEMPHCCAFMVSCNVNISSKFREKGLGKILNLFRIEIGKQLGYSAILCTDISTNIAQRKILKDNGWEDIYEIKNKRTNNLVHLTVKNL